MSSATMFESPLVQVDLNFSGQNSEMLSIREQAFRGHINLRGRQDDSEFTGVVEDILGFALPFAANCCVSKGSFTVLWLGPDEWLIITSEEQTQILLDALGQGLANTFSSVCDISSAQTIIEISGQNARELISSDCPLDIHPSAFLDGCCAQTRMAKTVITLYKTSDNPAYCIVVRRSFSDYLARWLLQVAKNSGFY